MPTGVKEISCPLARWVENANTSRQNAPSDVSGQGVSFRDRKGFICWQFPLLPLRVERGRRAKAFPPWVRDWLRRAVALPRRVVLRLGRGRRQCGEGRLLFFRRRRWTGKGQSQSKEGLIRWRVRLPPPRAGRGRRAKAFPPWVRDLAPPCRRPPKARRPPLGAWP